MLTLIFKRATTFVSTPNESKYQKYAVSVGTDRDEGEQGERAYYLSKSLISQVIFGAQSWQALFCEQIDVAGLKASIKQKICRESLMK